MYKELGSLTKFAKSWPSSEKVYRVHNVNGIPAQSLAEESRFSGSISPVLRMPQGRNMKTLFVNIGKRAIATIDLNMLVIVLPSPSDVVLMNAMAKRNRAPWEDLCSGRVIVAFSTYLFDIY